MDQRNAFDGRTILVIFLCLGIWWGWEKYLETKYPEAMGKAPSSSAQNAPVPAANAPANSAATESAAVDTNIRSESAQKSAKTVQNHVPEKIWTFENALWRVSLSSRGGRVVDVVLKKYTDKDNKPISLISHDDPGLLETSFDGTFGTQKYTDLDYTLHSLSDTKLEFDADVSGMHVKKTITVIPEKYALSAEFEISGHTETLQRVSVIVSQEPPSASSSDKSALSFLPSRGAGQDIQEYFFSHGTKTNRHYVTKGKSLEEHYDQTGFAALGSRYFTTILFNRGAVLPQGEALSSGRHSTLKLNYPILDAKNPVKISLDMYSGPKLVSQLKEFDEASTQVVDFGFFSWIAVPLLALMKLFYGLFKNYGLAIIGLTVLVRAVTFPFTYMSYKSMKSMQKIQPEIQRLKAIHKNNQAQLNQEMMKLMRENKVNPMGGCLPMLLQLPVFWALYQVLQNSIELYHSPFFGWIHDLSLKDPYYVLPVLMGLTMVIQQKLTPSTMDPSQARIMMIMPIFFTFIMVNLPSGLTLYIFISTLFGILQQAFMMKDKNGPTAAAVVRRA